MPATVDLTESRIVTFALAVSYEPRHPCSTMSDPDLSAELRQALQEQSFGIQSYEVISDPFEQAIIKLLEGHSINVKVTVRGWEVVEAPTVVYPYTASSSTSGRRYETLDNLLRSNSPEYAAKESQKLQDKLNALFEQQQ